MHVLITGASRGIGYELAAQALERGDHVTLISRKLTSGLKALKTKHGDRLSILKLEVTQESSLKKLAGALRASNLPVDVLINNAGVMLGGETDFLGLKLTQVRGTFDVNTIAPIQVTQAVLPALLKARVPRVVQISSLMGSIGDNGSGGYYAYRMSKAALNMFNRSLAHDFPNLIALTLHPGWVRTEMGGDQAPTLPADSARGLWRLILASIPSQSGKFFDFEGEELPW